MLRARPDPVQPRASDIRDRLAAVLAVAKEVAALPLNSDEVPAQLAQAVAAAVGRTHAEFYPLGVPANPERYGVAGRTAELLSPVNRAGQLPAERRAIVEQRAVEQLHADSSLPWLTVQALAARGKWRLLVAPLVAGGEVVGVIHLWTPNNLLPFTARDRWVALRIGQICGATFARSRRIGKIEQQLEERERLRRVSRAATAWLEPTADLQAIATAVLGVAAAESCAITFWRAETRELVVGAEVAVADWPGVDAPGFRYSLESWDAALAALTNRHSACYHAGDRAIHEYHRVSPTTSGVQSLLMTPILAGADCLGLMILTSRQLDAFGPEEVRFAREIADETSLQLQTVKLRETLRHQAATLTAIGRASEAVSANRGIRTILAEVAQAALSVENVVACSIERWHRSRDELEVVAAETRPHHLPPAPVRTRNSLADWPTGLAVLTGRRPLGFLIDASYLSPPERSTYADRAINAILMIPLLLGQECLGTLTFYGRERQMFDSDVIRLGQDLAAQATQVIDRSRLSEALRVQASVDGLTGLLNHRAIQESLDDELAKTRGTGAPLAVFFVDIDDFRLFNETHGHELGDRVLKCAASLLKESETVIGPIGRFGGDEFLVVAPNIDREQARQIAEQLLARAAETSVAIDQMRLPLVLSIGIAMFPDDGRDRRELIASAEASLFAAKESGSGLIGSEGKQTQSLEQTPFGSLLGLVRAVDRKDRYTRRHSDLVTRVAVSFARVLQLSGQEIEALEIAGALHDVGKIVVPDAILRKPGQLTMDELEVIRQHVTFGELIVQGVIHQTAVHAAIAHHHERWDGAGYPRGRAGRDIPLLGRILALADAYAAMIHDRPYRKARSREQTLAAIRQGAGTQFDPELTERFVSTVAHLSLDDSARDAPVVVAPSDQLARPTTS